MYWAELLKRFLYYHVTINALARCARKRPTHGTKSSHMTESARKARASQTLSRSMFQKYRCFATTYREKRNVKNLVILQITIYSPGPPYSKRDWEDKRAKMLNYVSENTITATLPFMLRSAIVPLDITRNLKQAWLYHVSHNHGYGYYYGH